MRGDRDEALMERSGFYWAGPGLCNRICSGSIFRFVTGPDGLRFQWCPELPIPFERSLFIAVRSLIDGVDMRMRVKVEVLPFAWILLSLSSNLERSLIFLREIILHYHLEYTNLLVERSGNQ